MREVRTVVDASGAPRRKTGDCETCGFWDTALLEGMCENCRDRYLVGSRNAAKPGRRGAAARAA